MHSATSAPDGSNGRGAVSNASPPLPPPWTDLAHRSPNGSTIPPHPPPPPTPQQHPAPSKESVTAPWPRGRLCLYLVLEFTSGFVEAFSYVYLGGIFSAFVTGTMVILGLDLAHASRDILPALTSVLCFCFGSWLAGVVRRRSPDPSDILLRTEYLLAVELLFLVPDAVVAAQADLDTSRGQYSCIALTAVAMSFQMAASISLSVKGLPTPVATSTLHRLFMEDPFAPGNRLEALKPLTQVVLLIVGAVVGDAIGRAAEPWYIVMIGCVLVAGVMVAMDGLRRSG